MAKAGIGRHAAGDGAAEIEVAGKLNGGIAIDRIETEVGVQVGIVVGGIDTNVRKLAFDENVDMQPVVVEPPASGPQATVELEEAHVADGSEAASDALVQALKLAGKEVALCLVVGEDATPTENAWVERDGKEPTRGEGEARESCAPSCGESRAAVVAVPGVAAQREDANATGFGDEKQHAVAAVDRLAWREG